MKKYDGWVVIGADFDTTQFDKKMDQSRKNIEKFEQDANEKQVEIDVQTKNIEKARQEVERLKKEYQDFLGQVDNEFENDEFHIPGVSDDVAEKVVTETVANMEVAIDKANAKLEKQQEILEKQKKDYSEIISKIEEENKKIEQTSAAMKDAQRNANQKQIIGAINNVNKGLDNAVKKVGKWTLSIFGAVSAFAFVRRAMTILSSYNEQLGVDLEYIRFALASTLLPVVEKIVQLIYRALQYIAYLLKALFGINIFANATMDAFNKTNKSLSKSVKNAKELKNQLAGFDEMNVLQDTSASGSDSGTGGGALPSFDLSEFEAEPPKWLKWIVDNKDIILAVLAGIAGALLALKLGFGPLESLGIGVLIGGIVYAIQGLLKYLKDPTFTNLGKVIQGIGIALLGLALIIGGPAGLVVAVVGAIVLIWGTIVKYWEQIKAFLQKGIDWLSSQSDFIHNRFGNTIGMIYDTFVSVLQGILNWADKTMKNIKANFNEIISFVKNVFAGNWSAAWQNVKNIFSNIWNNMKNTAISVFNAILSLGRNIGIGVGNAIAGAFKAVVNAVLTQIERILNKPIYTINSLIDTINKVPGINIGRLSGFYLPRLAKGGIVNMPGRGVPVGGAIAGEAGREAVLPLQDSQVLQEIADAIGSRITINANITNTMNGRVISRELQRINNESDFAFNR